MAAFMKLGDIKGEFQADELTGTFNALNETTNFKPTQREEIGIIHPSYMPSQGDEIGIIHPSYKPDPRGYDPGPVGSADGIGHSVGLVYWEQYAGTFDPGITTVRSGDAITGEGRPTNSWRNADPSPFEDRMPGDFDANDFHACPNKVKDLAGNFGDAAGNMTETFAGSFDLQQGHLPHEWEPFQPAAGMNSFGESLNPVAEIGGTAGPGGSSYMTGQFEMPTDNLGGQAGPGGTTF